MGDGNAAFRLASNLKTAWLGSTCQEYGVSAYARGFQLVLSQVPPFWPESNPRPTDVPVIHKKTFYSPVPFFFMFVTTPPPPANIFCL